MYHDADEVDVDGIRYRRVGAPPKATKVSSHLMYDCHSFRRTVGKTLRNIVQDWQEECLRPGEYGAPYLCPIIVMSGDKELRRVGKMVIPFGVHSHKTRAECQSDLEAFIDACRADPDIERLLSERIDA